MCVCVEVVVQVEACINVGSVYINVVQCMCPRVGVCCDVCSLHAKVHACVLHVLTYHEPAFKILLREVLSKYSFIPWEVEEGYVAIKERQAKGNAQKYGTEVVVQFYFYFQQRKRPQINLCGH